jgi:hypothetical protein
LSFKKNSIVNDAAFYGRPLLVEKQKANPEVGFLN